MSLDDIEKLLRSITQIKLSGGVVGKVCSVVMVVAVCFLVLGVWSGNAKIMAGGIGAIFLFAFPLLWKALNFAERNPQAALLEGAQFLVHQQMVLGTKTNPTLPIVGGTIVEEGDLAATIDEALVAGDDVADEQLIESAKPADNVGE